MQPFTACVCYMHISSMLSEVWVLLSKGAGGSVYLCFLFRYLLTTKLHHLFLYIYQLKREGQVTFREALRKEKKNFCESLRAQKGCHTIALEGFWHKRRRRLQIKHSKPTLVGGAPLRERIRFQGNVFKIEFLEALSLYVFRAVSSAKAAALTWPRSFLFSNSTIQIDCSCTYSHTLQSKNKTKQKKHAYPTTLPAE